jgi:hypothetical protein
MQNNTGEPADFVVLRFRCGRLERGSGLIRSVQEPDAPMNEPIRINQATRNEPQEVKNRRDMQERRAEMIVTEANAARSSQPGSTYYFYRIQVQNTGTKLVKSFVWEYQPAEETDPFNRQFYCVVNARANDKKEFELFSPLAPSRVIDASKVSNKSDAENNGRVVINKIEFSDGSVWKRPGWNLATFSPEDTSKVGSGKCIGI